MGCFLFILNGIIWFFVASFVASKNTNLAGWILWGGILGIPFLSAYLIDCYNKSKKITQWREKRKKLKLLFYREKLIKNATSSEKIFEQILQKNNIEYVFQKGFHFENKLFIVDFYLPKLNICIEIDGSYHDKEMTKRIDEIKEGWIRKEYKTKTLRFKNTEIKLDNEDKIIEKIKNI